MFKLHINRVQTNIYNLRAILINCKLFIKNNLLFQVAVIMIHFNFISNYSI